MNRTLLLATAGLTLLAACGQSNTAGNTDSQNAAANKDAEAKTLRDQIRIVGSSTVYPFSSYVAEELGALTNFKTPVVESNGSGGGMKLFCTSTGKSTPDITNASRRMKKKEFKDCLANGVTDVTEAQIGYDGIVVAHHQSNGALNLSREQLLLAVAKEVPQNGALVANPYTNWSQIDASLPNREISVYGPPTSSGTRDAFEELVMEALTKKMPSYGNQKYHAIRQDGVYIASGENDNLIVKKLQKNKNAIGIFGYSFLEENKGVIQAALIDGVTAEPENISSGKYPISRSLFFYVKNAHLEQVPGLSDFVELFMDETMIGPDGALTSIGLIPLPASERDALRASVSSNKKLTQNDL